MMQDINKIEVCIAARRFAKEIYLLTKDFPKQETYSMAKQLRRAAYSIGANIAEGAGRRTTKDFRHFLDQAMGSAKECEYFLALARDLEYLSEQDHKQINDELIVVAKRLNRFIQSLKVS